MAPPDQPTPTGDPPQGSPDTPAGADDLLERALADFRGAPDAPRSGVTSRPARIMEPELRCPISPDLRRMRHMVRLHARHHGLGGRRLEDLVLAVNEAVTNVLDHGDGTGTVVARGGPDVIVVDIVDHAGRLTHDHLADARERAHPHGLGLWVIQNVCDHVELDQNEQGSRLRLHMRTSDAGPRP